MRTTLVAVGIVVVAVLAAAMMVDWRFDLPAVAPSAEPICVETMRQKRPDFSWVAPRRDDVGAQLEIKTVTLGELLAHAGQLVRVAGVLHAEFESVGLYPSRAAMNDPSWRAPWVDLHPLWPGEAYWQTKGPMVSDRCVVVEGRYSPGPAGHFGMFNGMIEGVVRLDVWSDPHRPFKSAMPPPPSSPR
jgi:hypothetical protein